MKPLIKEENRDEEKILRDFRFLLDPEKDHYEPKKIVSAFNNNYIQHESMGSKGDLKKLLVLLIITIFNMKVWEVKTKI